MKLLKTLEVVLTVVVTILAGAVFALALQWWWWLP